MRIPCVGAIIRDEDGRILLVQRGHEPGRGLWSVPGGRIEPGETPFEAVRREILEETGLQIEVLGVAGEIQLPAASPDDTVIVTDYFARLSPESSRFAVAGDDAADVAWVTRAEASTLPLTSRLDETLESWGAWSER